MTVSYRIDTEHSILELMEAATNRYLGVQGHQIQIGILEESVHLSGHVRSWTDKQRLQESIRSLAGTRTIANEVHVQSEWMRASA